MKPMSIEDIASAFRVPKELINDEGPQSYQLAKEMGQEFTERLQRMMGGQENTTEREFLHKMAEDRRQRKGPLTYLVIAPQGIMVDVAVDKMRDQLRVIGVTVKRKNPGVVEVGADILFVLRHGFHHPHMMDGLNLNGALILGWVECPQRVEDHIKASLTAQNGWLLTA